jgi:hypothetical protein
MSLHSALVFPPSQVLAQWWKQLAPLHPKQLGVGYLLLHRVDAPVKVSRDISLDPLSLFVLKALELRPERSTEEVDRELHLGKALIGQVLLRLEGRALVVRTGANKWALASSGGEAVRSGTYHHNGWERREFFFLEHDVVDTDPYFINMQAVPSSQIPWPRDRPCRFDGKFLMECINRPAGWKKHHAFPVDVRALPLDLAAESGLPAWDRVILDSPRCLAGILVQTTGAAGRDRVLALFADVDGWVLQSLEPMFVLEHSIRESFPGLADSLGAENWHRAWQAWCRSRQVPQNEVGECRLEPKGCRLLVTAPKRLAERLRMGRSEVFRGREWLLAGEGLIRSAARIEIVESS